MVVWVHFILNPRSGCPESVIIFRSKSACPEAGLPTATHPKNQLPKAEIHETYRHVAKFGFNTEQNKREIAKRHMSLMVC
jgi:hypothetical protein